ncbi:MAG: RNA polymerase sigma-70 factor [Hymenobacter sp.]|nr:RNA polymerase sigma-70 factor [Hymenobacter sp.]
MSTVPSRLYASWTERALLDAMAASERGAFAEIYERYWYRVFALAYRKLRSRETAEELVQDLFATIWQKREERTIQQLEYYLLTAINRRVISYFRDQQVRVAYADFCRANLDEATDETQQALAATDLSEAFAKALLHLPPQSREVFRLSRLEHYSVPEIAGRLGLSPKAVEYHLTKALKLLRHHLREFMALLVAVFLI